MKIILYTSHCPKCKVVEMKLKQKKLEYTEISEITKITEYGKAHGIFSAPILDIDGKAYNFVEAVKFINER